ncbi:MAG: lipoprotein [Cellvibrionaceae bacterium]|nr:lipoprotein [Cellvibrionaceae bacterium]
MKLYFLVIGGLILIISACGQTGPLVLADHPTKDDQPALSSKAPETTENSHKPPEQSP